MLIRERTLMSEAKGRASCGERSRKKVSRHSGSDAPESLQTATSYSGSFRDLEVFQAILILGASLSANVPGASS